MRKYFWPIKSIGFLLGLLFITGVFTILAHYSFISKSSCEVEFVLRTPIPVDFAIYYDIGRGLTEMDHQTKRIEDTDQITTISFCIPMYSQFRGLRFDPGTQPIKMDIYSIILKYDDSTNFKVPFESLQPGNQIFSHSWDSTAFSFETISNADDPNILVKKLHEGRYQDKTKEKIFHYGFWILSAVMVMLVGRFIVLFFFLGV